MQRYTWEEAKKYMVDFNRKHGFRHGNTPTKGDPECQIVAVMKNKGFNRNDYTEQERSYVFTNNNKAFLDGMIGASIWSYNLVNPEDNSDTPRLDDYIDYEHIWEVDYCYILKEDD